LWRLCYALANPRIEIMENSSNENNPGAAHVPAQETGSKMDAVEKIELNSETEAIRFFQIVKEHLLDINHWSEFAGGALVKGLLTYATSSFFLEAARP